MDRSIAGPLFSVMNTTLSVDVTAESRQRHDQNTPGRAGVNNLMASNT
jgi:hypothetical protein